MRNRSEDRVGDCAVSLSLGLRLERWSRLGAAACLAVHFC